MRVKVPPIHRMRRTAKPTASTSTATAMAAMRQRRRLGRAGGADAASLISRTSCAFGWPCQFARRLDLGTQYGEAVHSACKAGLTALTKSLAIEVGKHGV